MANLTPITHCSAVEALTLTPASLAHAFPELLSALDEHIECERDLDDVEIFDLAYRNWLDDAEAAQLHLYDTLARLTGMAPVTSDDAPLHRMSLLIATLVREGTGEAFRRYNRLESDFLRFMTVPREGLDAVWTRHMLAAAREKIRAMAELTLYRQDGHIDGEACEFCAAA